MLSMSSPLDPFKTMKPYLGRKTILAYSWLSHFAALVTLKNALGGRGCDRSATTRRLWMPGGRWSTVVRWHRHWVTVCVKCCVAMDTVGFRRVWQRGDAKKRGHFNRDSGCYDIYLHILSSFTFFSLRKGCPIGIGLQTQLQGLQAKASQCIETHSNTPRHCHHVQASLWLNNLPSESLRTRLLLGLSGGILRSDWVRPADMHAESSPQLRHFTRSHADSVFLAGTNGRRCSASYTRRVHIIKVFHLNTKQSKSKNEKLAFG